MLEDYTPRMQWLPSSNKRRLHKANFKTNTHSREKTNKNNQSFPRDDHTYTQGSRSNDSSSSENDRYDPFRTPIRPRKNKQKRNNDNNKDVKIKNKRKHDYAFQFYLFKEKSKFDTTFDIKIKDNLEKSLAFRTIAVNWVSDLMEHPFFDEKLAVTRLKSALTSIAKEKINEHNGILKYS